MGDHQGWPIEKPVGVLRGSIVARTYVRDQRSPTGRCPHTNANSDGHLVRESGNARLPGMRDDFRRPAPDCTTRKAPALRALSKWIVKRLPARAAAAACGASCCEAFLLSFGTKESAVLVFFQDAISSDSSSESADNPLGWLTGSQCYERHLLSNGQSCASRRASLNPIIRAR